MLNKFNLQDVLSDLNNQQKEAVTFGKGPQLVIAGAGTGKTTVLTRRIIYLIMHEIYPAKEILALTFTDKAATEMETRVDLMLPYGLNDSTICTFHALGDKILREYGALLGIDPQYRILSTNEQIIFLREHLFDLPLHKLRPLSDPTRHIQLLLKIISRAKDENVSPDNYLNFCKTNQPDSTSSSEVSAWEKQYELAKVYSKYQKILLKSGLLDFGDLIMLSIKLLNENPDILLKLHEQYKYILVDEFQDTNAAQFELIRLLANPGHNLTVVGDDDQSIYKFRGAAISNILQFKNFYPETKTTVLINNYRSTQEILDSAYRLITHNNPERLEIKYAINKKLIAAYNNSESILYKSFDTVSSEADWLVKSILKQREEKQKAWSDFAVLVRTNTQVEPFIQALNLKGIPLTFSGNQALYRKEELRLCIAFLRVIADPNDTLSLYELLLSEIYNFPVEDLNYLIAKTKRYNSPLWKIITNKFNEEKHHLSDITCQKTTHLISDIKKYQELASKLSTGQVLYDFLTTSGWLAKYTKMDNSSADLIIKNLATFFNMIQRYAYLAKSDRVIHFVEHISMLEDLGDETFKYTIDEDIEAVNILTVHRAKGLEFPIVFLVGLAEQRFPPINRNPAITFPLKLSQEIVAETDNFLSEERRLFYVAMTRAKEKLFLTSAEDYGGRRKYKTSRFVLEALDLPVITPKHKITTSYLEKIKSHTPPTTMSQKISTLNSEQKSLSLSYYQIDDFLTCPLKYKYIHILKIPVLPHHTVLYGSALHQAIYEFHRLRMLGEEVNIKMITDFFLKAWINEGFISKNHEQLRQQKGIDILEKYIKYELTHNKLPKYIEKSFAFNVQTTKIIGRIDKVDVASDEKEVIITDFKSSEVTEQVQADKKARESLQLKIYALAWKKNYNILPQKMQLHFLESNIIGTTMIEPKKLLVVEDTISTITQEIKQQNFQAKPNAWQCNYCAYRIICPKAAS